MQITRIGVDKVRGVTAQIEVTERNLLLVGEMGSGKSAVIDAVRLALGQPTGYGDRGLDRLSPDGQWLSKVEFADGAVRTIERGMKRSRQHFKINGRAVDQKEYREKLASVIDLEPHHVMLEEFMGLSGQKRAGLFSAMLEDETVYKIDDVVQGIHNHDTRELFRREVGDSHMAYVESAIARLLEICGSPTELMAALKDEQNLVGHELRDARTRVDDLTEQQQSRLSHGQTGEEIKNKIQQIDEQLGGMKQRVSDLDLLRERYDAAMDLVNNAQSDVDKLRKSLDEARELAGQREACADALKSYDNKAAGLRSRLESARTEAVQLAEQRDAKMAEIETLRRGKHLIEELLHTKWEVDDQWLNEEFRSFLADTGLDVSVGSTVGMDCKEEILKFTREVVTEILGGSTQVIDTKLAGATSALESMQRQVEDADEVLGSLDTQMAGAEQDVSTAKENLSKAVEAADKILVIEAEIESKDRERAELHQKAQQSAPPEDEATIRGQEKSLKDERKLLADQLKEYEASNALTGQLEEARYRSTAAETVCEVMKVLADIVQRWRDEGVAKRLAEAMGPFNEAFAHMFGSDVNLRHHSDGSGRSTEFFFTINRHGSDVPFDLLSDGETVMAAAAFLSALQRMKETPGSMLSMNTEPLSDMGLAHVIHKAPKLGFDFVMLSNNHGVPDEIGGWQVVKMEI